MRVMPEACILLRARSHKSGLVRAKLATVKRGSSVASFVFAAFSLTLLAAAQTSGGASDRDSNADQTINIRVDTNLVVVPVTVTDKANRFVLGSKRRTFRFSKAIRRKTSPTSPARMLRFPWGCSSIPAAAWA